MNRCYATNNITYLQLKKSSSRLWFDDGGRRCEKGMWFIASYWLKNTGKNLLPHI